MLLHWLFLLFWRVRAVTGSDCCPTILLSSTAVALQYQPALLVTYTRVGGPPYFLYFWRWQQGGQNWLAGEDFT